MGQRFGQHFLKDKALIQDIIKNFNPSGPIIEIGPGLGALTYTLLALNNPLWVIEIDHALQTLWDNKRIDYPHLSVIKSDVLAMDWEQWRTWHNEPFNIISNLPYEISGPFLIRLAKHTHVWSQTTLLLQKDIVQKVLAMPSQHNYGRLSVQVQRYCDLIPGRTVAPGAFQPPPKVMSQFLHLTPKKNILKVPSEALWDDMLRMAFSHRRQMLRRIFKDYPIDWQYIGIDPTVRPENLSVEQWVHVSYALEKK